MVGAMDGQDLAGVLLRDLDTVVARTREAYLARVPRMRQVGPEALDQALEATRLTMRQFTRYYLEGTLDTKAWRAVRDATIARAGETFSQAEILDIIDIAHSVGRERVDSLADENPGLEPEDRARLATLMDRYVAELSDQEDRRLASPDSLDDILGALEAEGADLQ
jgi:hypothetical protein